MLCNAVVELGIQALVADLGLEIGAFQGHSQTQLLPSILAIGLGIWPGQAIYGGGVYVTIRVGDMAWASDRARVTFERWVNWVDLPGS